MSYYGDRNFQLQGSYTRYYDGLKAGFDSKYGPSKRRNFSTLEKAIKAAKKELRENDLPKVARIEEYTYTDERGRKHESHRAYSEDGHEFEWGEDYSYWHVDALRIVDRVTQNVLWES